MKQSALDKALTAHNHEPRTSMYVKRLIDKYNWPIERPTDEPGYRIR